jgi:DNA-binding transcriptional LysR family regulator
VTVLYDEPRVLVVPLDHRLAGKESVTLDDIADEPLPRVRQSDPAWSAFWRIDPRPDGRPARDGPLVEPSRTSSNIAAGQAVAISAGLRADSFRPDLTTVPLEGVEPSHVVLATRAGDHHRLVAAFRKSPKPTSPVPARPNQRAPRHHEPRNDRHRTATPTAPSN